jgi:UDPglucose--hexose-1-phosphate uridylyltransferase
VTDTNEFSAALHPHRRFNPLSGRWTLVSPQRTQRPWQGRTSETAADLRPRHDPDCYLCPGNERAGGVRNPEYTHTFVFRNDFPALLDDTPPFEATDDLYRLEAVRGECRVTCFSPRHDLTLARMDEPDIRRVVDLWAAQQAELELRWRWVQVFENHGAVVGTSNPHPHGQVWASDFLPVEITREDDNQRRYRDAHGSPLLLDYARKEAATGERVVVENDHWLVVVPFWAYWPYETLVLPKRAVQRLTDLTGEERDALATVLKRMLVRFDNLFQTAFPYCSGWHGAPAATTDSATDHWQLHGHYLPPLLRSATVQKFVASYEWLAEQQRDLTPEEAAARLRAQSERHYLGGAA